MSQHRGDPRIRGTSFARSARRVRRMWVASQQLKRLSSEFALGSVDLDAAGAHVRVEPRSELCKRIGHT